jgi:TolB protein
MNRLSEAKYLAPTLHAILFTTAWSLYAVSGQPMMDGLSALPFLLLMIADLPISFVAFGVLFSSTKYGPFAVVLWGVGGTLWWYWVGRSIDARRRSVVNSKGSSSIRFAGRPTMWGAWLAGGLALLAAGAITLTWAARSSEKSNHGGAIGSVTFSPDGQSVLLSRSEGESEFLYKVDLQSGSAARLTAATSGFEGSSSYSPDGTKIAFSYTAERGEHSRIFVMDANGANAHPLFQSDTGGEDLFPKFAADGKKIYFASSAFFGHYSPIATPSLHEWDLYSVDLDGRNVQQLTNERLYQITEPSLSADGKRVLFSIESGTGSQMRLYSLDSRAPVAVLQPHVPNEPRGPIYADAVLAPDGRSVVFLAASEGRKAYDYDVYRLDLASNAIDKLTTANGYATNLCLSSDGKSAVFLRWSSKLGSLPTVSQMYFLDLTTKSLRPLPVNGAR